MLTFLQVLCGASRPFEESAGLLSQALGFSISSTAVQSNTEAAGEQLENEAYRVIDPRWRAQGCEELIVQMDSTTSPEIQVKEGVAGRESLKAPTEYQMCHVGVMQRRQGGVVQQEWTVGRCGTLEAFGMHLGRTGLGPLWGWRKPSAWCFSPTGGQLADLPGSFSGGRADSGLPPCQRTSGGVLSAVPPSGPGAGRLPGLGRDAETGECYRDSLR